jgi:hypothetical protein
MEKKTYKIEIQYYPHSLNHPEIIEITTDNLDWSMIQYARNRRPFSWKQAEKKCKCKTCGCNNKLNV